MLELQKNPKKHIDTHYNVGLSKETYNRLKDISKQTNRPIRHLVDLFLNYAIDHVKIVDGKE